MKKSMIIGKRQMILAGLVFALAIAVWLNMNYAAKDGGFDIAAELTSSKYLGEAQYVGASDVQSGAASGVAEVGASVSDPLEPIRKNRSEVRKEAVELLEDTIEDAKTGGADVTNALAKIAEISDRMDNEASIETLLSAKGFNAIVVIGDTDVTVSVVANELMSNQTMQIQDAVTGICGTRLENIKIVAIK